MPSLNQFEIRKLAEQLVTMMLAEMLQDQPGVKKAVNKVSKDSWVDTLVSLYDSVEEVLLNRFGHS